MKHMASFLVLLGMSMATQATTLPLPGVNLGATSFEDGGGGKGTFLQWSTSRFEASRLYDAEGNRAPVRYARELWVHRLHAAYTTPVGLAGGYLGAEAVVPLTDLTLQSGALRGHASGVGNPTVGVFVQWLDKRLLGHRFDSRLSLGVALPWGNYRRDATLNPGTPYLSFNPYYAFTLRPTERWEVSGRFMYLWNGVSHDPERRLTDQFGAPVHSIQPGQALHYNVSASYAVAPQWRLGVGMYHLQQLSTDRINGQAQAHSRDRILGVGPGGQWRKGQHRVIGNLYSEGLAQNRPAGTQLVLRYMYVF
jgi:hypothetical protein